MATKALTPAALMKAPGLTYADWIAAGWTDELLARGGYIFDSADPRTPVCPFTMMRKLGSVEA